MSLDENEKEDFRGKTVEFNEEEKSEGIKLCGFQLAVNIN